MIYRLHFLVIPTKIGEDEEKVIQNMQNSKEIIYFGDSLLHTGKNIVVQTPKSFHKHSAMQDAALQKMTTLYTLFFPNLF